MIIRETNIVNLRIYWKSMAEMYIPLSLFEGTMYSENQIFDAISLEDLRNLMKQYFYITLFFLKDHSQTKI